MTVTDHTARAITDGSTHAGSTLTGSTTASLLPDFRAALAMTRSDTQAVPAARAALRAAADVCRDTLAQRWAATQAARGLSLADVLEAEPDAALGNGGLGRLAACFLDSFAETGLPSFGYGLRYRYGMFAQGTQDGRQIERPDDWLRHGALWDIERPDVEYIIGFGGRVESDGIGGRRWQPAERVLARAYDFIVPAHHGERVSTLRQWQASAEDAIDFAAFCRGDHAAAARHLISEADYVMGTGYH